MHQSNPNNITEILHSIVDYQANQIHHKLRDLGLNTQQARLLRYINEHPGAIQKDVAKYLNRQNATITNMLKNMAAQKYIVRKIPDDNERQKKIYLLPKGEKVINSIDHIFTDIETQANSVIPDDEKFTFTKQLMAIRKVFSEDKQ